MYSQKLSTHTTILGNALTPSDQTVEQKTICISAFSFTELLSNKFVEKNNFPKNTYEKIGYLIAAKFFNTSLCTGLPKSNYNIQNDQVVFSSSSVIQYYKEINILISFWSLFSSNFVNVINEIIQGKKTSDYFSKATDEFVKLLNTIQCFSKIIQLDIKSLPKDFEIVDLDPQITSFMEKSIQFLQEGDKLRVMKIQKMNVEQQESNFIKELQELNDSATKFQQIFDGFQKQIKDHFIPLYNEQPYNEWQQYCYNFADAVSSIVFLSYLIAESDPIQFFTVIDLLQEMVDNTFTMISQYICALRLRGDFNECHLKSKASYDKFPTIINQIYEIVTGMIDKCPAPLIEYYKDKIPVIFTYLKNLYSEYNQNVEKLVTVMKDDQKFSFFIKQKQTEKVSNITKTVQKVNPIKNSTHFEVPQRFVDILFQLASSFLSDNQISHNEIVEKYNLLNDEFNRFSSALMKYINDFSDIKEKAIYLQHYNFTLSTVTKFIPEIHLFIEQKSDILRIRTGILCSYVLLSLYSLDSKIERNSIIDLRRILISTFNSFPSKLNEIQQSLKKVVESSTSGFNQQNKNVIIYLSYNIDRLLEQSKNLLQSNLYEPNCIRKCIHLFDDLQYLFYSFSSFGDVENKSISMYASVFKGLADSYRLSIQIQIINLFTEYCINMKSFINNTSNQDNSLFDLIGQIEQELENKPPYSIFNNQFLVKLKNLFKNIKTPSLNILKSSNNTKACESIINSLDSILDYVNKIDYISNLSVTSVLGPLFLLFKNDSAQDTSKVVNTLVSDHSEASLCTFNFVNTINNVILLLDKTNDLKQMSEQIKSCYSKMIEDSCYLSFGQNSYIQSLSTTIKDLTTIIDGLDSAFQKYTDELKIKSNNYCEMKNKNIENEPIIDNNSDENVENDPLAQIAIESSSSSEDEEPPIKSDSQALHLENDDIPSEILHLKILENTKNTQESLNSFVQTLLMENGQPNQIASSLSALRDSIVNLIQIIDKLINFSWNPIQQRNLSVLREKLLKLIDTAIIVSQSSILRNDEWRSLVSTFNDESNDLINNVIRSSENIIKDEKLDLFVENETERELINAAQFVSKSIKRLHSMSDDQKNIIACSIDSVGLNVIDVAQPIFLNAAKIIEASRSKVKSILNSGNALPTQNGFLENTKNLIESLSLILNVAESKSCSDPESLSEILEHIRSANTTIVHFLVEMKKSM